MIKLTKEDIQYIDEYLVQNKIKFLDVRVEIIDHLASDFEEKSKKVLLEDYLESQSNFVKKLARKRQKTIHWHFQNKLLKQFFKFFYQPKYIILLTALIVLSVSLLEFISLKAYSSVCYFSLVALVIYPFYYQIKHSKALKDVQSMQSLFAVTSLPSVFLYSFILVRDECYDNPLILFIYFGLSILLGLSAAVIIEKERRVILNKYHQLINAS